MDNIIKHNIKEFVLAGNCTFTMENTKTGNRLTYKIKKLKDDKKQSPDAPDIWFVNVLTGSDNDSDYTFIGSLRVKGDKTYYNHSHKSRIGRDAQSVKSIIWFVICLNDHKIPDHVNFYHKGHCAKCARTLTVPESILSGFGPICFQMIFGKPLVEKKKRTKIDDQVKDELEGLKNLYNDGEIESQEYDDRKDALEHRKDKTAFAEYEMKQEEMAFMNKMKREG